MKIESSDTTDIFGCVRFGSNGFNSKGRPSMISAKYRLKEERRKVLKISIGKLKRIEDPESSLRRSVLINNTMKRLQREAREEKLQRQGIYQPIITEFEREEKPVNVPIIATTTTSISPATPANITPEQVTNDVTSMSTNLAASTNTSNTSTTTTTTTTTPSPAVNRKRPAREGGDTSESDECDVQDVLSHFYMPPTPRLITSIDDEDDMVPDPKRQRLDNMPSIKDETNEDSISQLPSMSERLRQHDDANTISNTNNNNNSTTITIHVCPSSLDSSRLQSDSIKIPPSNNNNNNNEETISLNSHHHLSSTHILSERLESEGENKENEEMCFDTTELPSHNNNNRMETVSTSSDIQIDVTDTDLVQSVTDRLGNNHDDDDDDEDEVIDVVNETSSPFETPDFSSRLSSDDLVQSMDTTDDTSFRLREFCDDRYNNSTLSSSHDRRSPASLLPSATQSNQINTNAASTPSSSPTPMLVDSEQQHFSCGHSSIFGELQSVVFHSLIASLES